MQAGWLAHNQASEPACFDAKLRVRVP